MMEDDLAAGGEAATASPAGSPAAKQKARAKGKGMPAEKVPKVCAVPSCDDPHKAGSKFCKCHTRSKCAMIYQAESQGDEALAAVQELLAGPTAGEEVEKFAKLNPPDAKYIRKTVINWTAYARKKFQETSVADRELDTPMTKAVFGAHCKYVLGLTDEEGEAYWLDFYNDSRVDRDLNGFRGREQLWIPKAFSCRERAYIVDRRSAAPPR